MTIRLGSVEGALSSSDDNDTDAAKFINLEISEQIYILHRIYSHYTKFVLQTNLPRIGMVYVYFQNRNELYFHMGYAK